MADFGEVKIFSSATTIDVQHVETSRLEVSGGVIRLGNKDLGIATVLFGSVKVGHRQEPEEKMRTRN